ncbi:MAG: T9SS type A sorting domain-containing protein [Candidatus Cloacimonetes bacterium]|nr:T9SS type A sorting domain-containing protein [Candidatus Cloacimonadota bacterium]
MRKLTGLIILMAMLSVSLASVDYTDAWSSQGFTLAGQSVTGVDIDFSIEQISFEDITINGRSMTNVTMPGIILPNDEGAPNLPGDGRWIAMPQGTKASFSIIASRLDTYQDVDIAPAPRIPFETEDGPLEYRLDPAIYELDAFYPASPVMLSEPTQLRGVDAVILGVTPFQYNPVTRELRVYRDLQVRVDFAGGNGHFGEDRLRSRWWDPILQAAFINAASLPEVDYPTTRNRTPDYEYIILTPDQPDYIAWADSMSLFRNRQGIATGVVTTTQIGGNTAANIETFVDDAYDDWDVPPVAMLVMGDYGTGAGQITSPVWSSYCISDNYYADVSGNHLPDISVTRMTANNADQLAIMMEKALSYEQNPPTNPEFYSNPVMAGGWQSSRWFILCTEVVRGFLVNELGKTPVREYAIYSGTPGGAWSTNENTSMVVNFFGPDGLGYIPATSGELNDWGGNATRINADINSGAFMMLHRDHGSETGWGEPDYDIDDLDGLVDNDLFFVFSLNCLTGKFNIGGDCFAEAFHRYEDRAIGVIAASETSHSFVNDTFCWGMMDYMWPEFNPDYGLEGPHSLMPGFANAYGKLFLQASSWPSNPGSKEMTHYLFHCHGDTFTRLYEEVPQNLTVDHLDVMPCGLDFFEVTADEGALIGLSVNGEVIGTAIGTGAPLSVTVDPQFPPAWLDITVTMQNYYRYETSVMVVPLDVPFLIYDSVSLDDSGGNSNSLLDYCDGNVGINLSLENVGEVDGENVTVTLNCSDASVTITDGVETGCSMPGQSITELLDAFAFDIDGNVDDGHIIEFTWDATDGTDAWDGDFTLEAHAPILELGGFTLDDSAQGNDNGRMDPGETVDVLVDIRNMGASQAFSVIGEISTNDPYLTIDVSQQGYGDINVSGQATMAFTVSSNANTPIGHMVNMDMAISADFGLTATADFHFPVGQIPVLIVAWDANPVSAQGIMNSLAANDISASIVTELPDELNMFTSVFVCLGVSGNNHVLSDSEALELENFLQQGGKLYMEGGDTWYADPQTPLHASFHITANSNGGGNLGPVLGQTGTFAQGMNFSYTGNNVSIDHMLPVVPAQTVFRNYNPSFACMIAYDEGNFQTIGASMCFGSLINGAVSKDQLMAAMMEFFDISGSPIGNISGTVTLVPAGDVELVDITIGSFTIHPEADGAYSVDLAPGQYTLTVSMDDYETLSETVTLDAYDLLVIDWELIQMTAPSNLEVAIDDGEATLTWDEAVQLGKVDQYETTRDFVGYNIYLSTDGDDFELLDFTTDLTYTTEPAWNTLNQYYVTAMYDGGESQSSNTVEALLLSVPENLEGYADGYDAVLEWESPSLTGRLEFAMYRVYCNEDMVHEIADFETTTWTHADLDADTYTYCVTAMWGDYESDDSNTIEVVILSSGSDIPEPVVTGLGDNFPNPFNPVTTIPYSLAADRTVSITVYNILGQAVRTFDLGMRPGGHHSVTWDGTDASGCDVSSGIYFIRLRAGDYTEVRKAILMK